MEKIKTISRPENIETDMSDIDFIAYCEDCDCAAIVLDEKGLRRNSLIEWHRKVDSDCPQTLELYGNKETIKTARGSLHEGVKRMNES